MENLFEYIKYKHLDGTAINDMHAAMGDVSVFDEMVKLCDKNKFDENGLYYDTPDNWRKMFDVLKNKHDKMSGRKLRIVTDIDSHPITRIFYCLIHNYDCKLKIMLKKIGSNIFPILNFQSEYGQNVYDSAKKFLENIGIKSMYKSTKDDDNYEIFLTTNLKAFAHPYSAVKVEI